VMEASHTLLAERFEIHHATLQPEPMTRTVHWREPRGEGRPMGTPSPASNPR